MSESSVKCNNCGQKTTGDHCEWCGYPLTRHGAPGRKYYLILALLLALVLSGVGYAYTYTTASGTIGGIADEDIATVNATTENQPDWDSLEPEPGGTETLRPDAAGDECNITNQVGAVCPNHYQNVDDETPDGDTTEVWTKAQTWERDLYDIEDHSLGTDIITAVRVYAHAQARENPSQASLKLVLKSGAAVSESFEKTITTSWADYSNTWIMNPETGAAFTWTAIDSLQVGINLRESASDKKSEVTQVYLEVDYGEPICGEVPTGDLFDVTVNPYYTGDMQVKVYLTNTDELTKAYVYLNMKLYLEGSVEAGQTRNYQLLTLSNGRATFNLEDYAGLPHTLSVTGGSYCLVSDDISEWEAGWTLTPELYCEATQR